MVRVAPYTCPMRVVVAKPGSLGSPRPLASQEAGHAEVLVERGPVGALAVAENHPVVARARFGRG
jgi:hypothetical protein